MATRVVQMPIMANVDLSQAQQQIEQIRSGLTAALKVDSSSLGRLNSLLNDLSKDAERINRAFDKGFISQSEVSRASRELSGMQNILSKIDEAIKKIDPKDLDILPAEMAKFEEANEHVQAFKREIAAIEKIEIQDLFRNTKFAEVARQMKMTQSSVKTLEDINQKLTQEQQRRKDVTAATEAQIRTLSIQTDLMSKYANNAEEALRLEEQMAAIKKQVRTVTSPEGTEVSTFMAGGRNALNKLAEEFGLAVDKVGAADVQKVFDIINASIAAFKGNMEPLNAIMAQYAEEANKVTVANQQVGAAIVNTAQQTIELESNVDSATKAYLDLTKSFIEGKISSKELVEGISGIKDTVNQAAGAVPQLSAELQRLEEQRQRLDKVEGTVKRWLSFGTAMIQVRKAVQNAFNQIKELDTAMTNIAVVTDYTTAELWGNIDAYMQLAQQYGATTKGVLEVAEIYYQQGLDTATVNHLVGESLKMARIAGMQYADATDAMTVAMRAFNINASEAARITDVYSKVAGISAASTEELAIAMSKTASGVASLGASFENTVAMLGLMQEATREAPEKISGAYKKI